MGHDPAGSMKKGCQLHPSPFYGRHDVKLPLNDELIFKLKDTRNGSKPRIFVQRKALNNKVKAITNLQEELKNWRMLQIKFLNC